MGEEQGFTPQLKEKLKERAKSEMFSRKDTYNLKKDGTEASKNNIRHQIEELIENRVDGEIIFHSNILGKYDIPVNVYIEELFKQENFKEIRIWGTYPRNIFKSQKIIDDYIARIERT